MALGAFFPCFLPSFLPQIFTGLPSVPGVLLSGASQMTLVVKNPPASAGGTEKQVQSLRWEDPLEEGMATHSSIRAWRIPWTEEPGGLQSMGS